MLDEKDLLILEHLRGNARMTAPEIARKTKIPARTVLNRIRHLEKEGVILQYITRINFSKIGFDVLSYILVEADYAALKNKDNALSELAQKISKRFPYLSDVCTITGDSDILIKARSKDIPTFNRITEQLRRIEGVARTKTMVVLHDTKVNASSLPIVKMME